MGESFIIVNLIYENRFIQQLETDRDTENEENEDNFVPESFDSLPKIRL
jgi:hypothetical protein